MVGSGWCSPAEVLQTKFCLMRLGVIDVDSNTVHLPPDPGSCSTDGVVLRRLGRTERRKKRP